MTHSRDLVKRHIAAFNAQDVNALLADFAPGAEWVTGDYAVPPGELRAFFTRAMESITPKLTLIRTIADETTVAAEMSEEWTHNRVEKSASLITVFDLVDGKIARAKVYREGSADA